MAATFDNSREGEAGQRRVLPPSDVIRHTIFSLGFIFFDDPEPVVHVRYSDGTHRSFWLSEFEATQRERYQDFRGTVFEIVGAPEDWSDEEWARLHIRMARPGSARLREDWARKRLETAD